MTISDFIDTFVDSSCARGYLAQHALFDQVHSGMMSDWVVSNNSKGFLTSSPLGLKRRDYKRVCNLEIV